MGGEDYAPPPGPPPGYRPQQGAGHVGWAPSGSRTSEQNSSNAANHAEYLPPQGPPPSRSDAPPAYEPPPGAPPGWIGEKKENDSSDYAPPPGPPPSWTANNDYAPPPGPPPSHQSNEPAPPPYDPWMAVPDSNFLPPPPSLRDERSPAANANYDDAAAGHLYCRKTPLWPAQRHTAQALERIQAGDIYLTMPPITRNAQVSRRGIGKTHVVTNAKCTDSVFISDIPLYAAASPYRPRTIYFELKVLRMGSGREEAGIAIGFLAPPYPSWRLPGWHRASIGVHGDDGRRYVDDSYGGVDFTAPFKAGDVVGIGMTFSPPTYAGGKNGVRVFFTRNGREDGGWDLHEEVDAQADVGNVEGLEGGRDVLAAVGAFGAVEFEVRMREAEWMFRRGV